MNDRRVIRISRSERCSWKAQYWFIKTAVNQTARTSTRYVVIFLGLNLMSLTKLAFPHAKKKKQPNSCAYRCWNCYGQRCQHYWCKDENDVLAPFQKALRDRGIHRIRGNCLCGTGRFLASVFRILSSIFAYGFRWEANHICYPYFHSVHFLIHSCSNLKSTETGLFVLRRISLAARST